MSKKDCAIILLMSALVVSGVHTVHVPVYSAAAPQSVDWVFGGDATGDQVGYAVGSAGDLNGDGYGDVVVGAPKDRLTIDKEGVVSVFYGGPQGLPAAPDWQVGSGQSGSHFGGALAGAGDVNGDGYDDLLVGAPEFKAGGNKKGAVFLFLGSPTGLGPAAAWTVAGDQQDGLYGYAVGSAGDVNGDGYDDWAIGARAQSPSDPNAKEGAAYLFLGSEEPLGMTPHWVYYGDRPGALAGTSIAGAGDVNGDGYDDVLVGAPGYSGDLTEEGALLLFLGGVSGLATQPDWRAVGGEAGAWLGTSVSGAGDVDGDGLDDLLAGAPYYDTVRVDTGAMFLFYGRAPTPATGSTRLAPGLRTGSLFGHAVAGGGDLNGDGYDDVIGGAHMVTLVQRMEGAVFAFYGSGEGIQTRSGWYARGEKADSEFGHSVAIAARVRGEAVGSVMAGAPSYRLSTEPEGRAAGFYGPLDPVYPDYRVCLPLVVRTQP